ncbi:MAG: cytochrome P460 family protein [Alphaproteobacteria bacterium]|jgi:hypothetical protein|nr:cytochrome P460 family protein [Alphaproteobacteria bacterium]MDP6269361.1 cytochrome P460 family protein [Alphaproteobacteria bacterium]
MKVAAKNPCAAKGCNPCAAKNPCATQACNPCAAAEVPELTQAEAVAAYDCARQALRAAYAKSGLSYVGDYADWSRFSLRPYVSDTHGGRYVNNFGNALAQGYGKYEKAGPLPVGAMLAKDSFVANASGRVVAGPLFTMEKMAAGFNKPSGNWRYSMVLPNGSVFGTTGGKNSGTVAFCIECHASVEDQDHLFFLPEEHRL